MKRSLVIALLLFFAENARAEVRYQAIDLTDEFEAFVGVAEDGQFWTVTGMNNSGQLCGYRSSRCEGHESGYIYSSFVYSADSGFVDLSESVGEGWVRDINDQGQVVGLAGFADDEGRRPFLWDPNNGVRYLDELEGSPFTMVVNNSSQIMACMPRPDDVWATYVWDDGVVTDIGHLNARRASGFDMEDQPSDLDMSNWTFSFDMNNRGDVVGYSVASDDKQHAFSWSSETGMTDLHLSGRASLACGINDAGEVVGEAEYGDIGFHATVWTDGEPTNIDTLDYHDSRADSVNNSGQVVGSGMYTELLPGGDQWYEEIAFYWDSETGMHPLPELILGETEWHIASAQFINDEGWIFVKAYADPLPLDHAPREYALLLKPVPEPGTALLFCLSLTILGLRRRPIH